MIIGLSLLQSQKWHAGVSALHFFFIRDFRSEEENLKIIDSYLIFHEKDVLLSIFGSLLGTHSLLRILEVTP